MKTLSPGTVIHAKHHVTGRIRRAVVVTVTDQNTITVRIGQTVYPATRGASNTTRGTVFTTA